MFVFCSVAFLLFSPDFHGLHLTYSGQKLSSWSKEVTTVETWILDEIIDFWKWKYRLGLHLFVLEKIEFGFPSIFCRFLACYDKFRCFISFELDSNKAIRITGQPIDFMLWFLRGGCRYFVHFRYCRIRWYCIRMSYFLSYWVAYCFSLFSTDWTITSGISII